MSPLAAVKPYLPLAVRVVAMLVAAVGPIAACLVAKQPVTNEILTAPVVAASAAWKRWHPSATVAAVKAATG